MAIILPQISGLADSKWSGVKHSVAKCVGLDLHSTPGLVQVHQKLTKNSGATVDAFCRVSLTASNGYQFWFSSTTGKIFARNSSGTWSLAYTTVAGAGTSGCSGAMEYNGFIYFATQSRLHRIAIADADDTWASVSLNWKTFTVTDADFHPMAIQDNTLFIGDGYRVASVDDAGTFNNAGTGNSLDILTPHRIKTLLPHENDLLLGTFIAGTVAKAAIVRWDCVSPSWSSWDDVDEVGVNCLFRDDNYVYAQCGRAGAIYFYTGEKLEPFTRIPGTWTPTRYGEVYPGSAARFKGIPVFGLSNSPDAANSTGNPADQGLYRLGSYSRNYPKVLDLSFVISEAVVATIEMGAVLVEGNDLFVAWKNGSSFGVDKLDYTAKYASAYFETTMLFREQRDEYKTLGRAYSLYETLPTSTSITFNYKSNHASSYTAMTSETDTKIKQVQSNLSLPEVGALQIRVEFGVSSNDAPTLEVPLGIDLDATQ